MKLVSASFRAAVLAAGLATGSMAGGAVGFAQAEELTESHIAIALEVARLSLAKNLDLYLPNLSQQVQNTLIRVRPDQHEAIGQVVDAQALAMVKRRIDLDNDVARIFAKYFTEDELKQISAFYKSPAGAKLAAMGPDAMQESFKSADGWSKRIGEELLQKSVAELKKKGIDF